MKKQVKKIKYLFRTTFIIVIILFSSLTFAASIITKDAKFSNDISPITNESIEETTIIETTELSEEEKALIESSIAESYQKAIFDVIASVTKPEVTNLPTLLSQPYDRPLPDDHFGVGNESVPIFAVNVKPDDEQRKNCMSLTFDSAYINKYTFQILDILNHYNAKATFFMTFEFMKKNPKHVMEIISRGHEIGNHSTTHPDFNTCTDLKIIAEVWQAHDYIKNLVGVEMCLFRFPFGSYSPRTVNILKNLGYYPIQWTFDSIDWRNDGVEYLKNRFSTTEHLAPGSIILFHNGATYTPEALPFILDLIKEKGLKCVRVSDLIYRHDFCVDTGHQISLK